MSGDNVPPSPASRRPRTLRATLYGIPGSHAVRTGQLMLEYKQLPFRRIDIPPGVHRAYVRLRGFSGDRVPAVQFPDGRRAQNTRPLARALDEVRPEPRLVPDDPRVEEAERWGDDVLQQWARRMVVEAGVRDPDALHARGGAGRLGPLLTKHEASRRLVVRAVWKAFGMSSEQLAQDRRRTPELLDRVDAWIADGVLGGDQLNCADFQIATSLALVDYRYDVRAELRGRPAAELMERVLPEP
jgi:glutathione S-transferase